MYYNHCKALHHTQLRKQLGTTISAEISRMNSFYQKTPQVNVPVILTQPLLGAFM